MEIKELDGQRSLTIEVNPELPGSVFLSCGSKCMEFDRGVFLNAVRRMGIEFSSAEGESAPFL